MASSKVTPILRDQSFREGLGERGDEVNTKEERMRRRAMNTLHFVRFENFNSVQSKSRKVN